MDKIEIQVEANTKSLQELNKQLDELREKNSKLEQQVAADHEKGKARHKEKMDGNEKLMKQFEELGEKIVAAFAVEKIIEFAAESVKAFAEAKEAAEKLKFALLSINKESAGSFEILNEEAERLSKSLNTLFTPTQIRGVQTQLANFGLAAEKIRQLTPSIINLATATGKTLPEATEKVILALNGQTKGLRDVGISFEDTGSKTKNYQKTLEQLEKFEGSAEEQSHSLAGTLQEQKNKWEELKVTVGGGLTNLFVGLATTFEDMWHNIKEATLQLLGFEAAAEQAQKKELDLSQLTVKQLEEERQARVNNVEEIEKGLRTITDLSENSREKLMKGQQKQSEIQKEIARIDAELAIRNQKIKDDLTLEGERKAKEAAERLKRLWEKYYHDLEEIRRKDAEDFAKANIDLIEDETLKKIAAEDLAFQKQKLELGDREKELNDIIKAGLHSQDAERRKAAKEAQDELKNLHADQELAEEVHQKKMLDILKKHDEEDEKRRLDENKKNAQAEIEKSEIRFKYGEIENKRALVNKKKTQEEFDKQQKELEIAQLEEKLEIERRYGIEDVKLQQEIEMKKLDLQKKTKDETKQMIKELHEFTVQLMEVFTKNVESNIHIIEAQQSRQEKMVEYQKVLAEKGLANDLAFEEKRADELAKKKIMEEKKLKRIKELETFLNAIARFSEDNPKTALPKALGLLAATRAAEAVFAEDGGIIGQGDKRSIVGINGMSRRHRSGNDVLLHAEKGEGILSVREMKNLGAGNFHMLKSMLKTPFMERLAPQGNPVLDSTQIVQRLESLEHTIKNKKEVNIDIDGLNQWVTTEIENGIRKVTRNYNPNARRQI